MSEPLGTSTIVAGQYELLRTLGHGSFGRTFLAHDRTRDRQVAIKLLDPRTTADWKSYERFEREAAVLRALRHHGIPEVFALIQDQWQGAAATFLVMEYVEGVSLERIIAEHRPLDAADVVSIFLEQLGILEYLHSRIPPILHRDIKPANIIVRPNGLPALVDFGSVRSVFLDPNEGGSTIAGTYGYMPYEQYMGQASPASDLYALAATFLHLLTGRPPREFMSEHGRIEVPDTLPGDTRMRAVLMQLLQPSPADRPQSAREVRQLLLTSAAVAVTRPGRTGSNVARQVNLSPTVPRALEGETARLLDDIAPSTLELMDGSAKPTDVPGILDWLALAFFSVITVGVLPITFIAMARARRRRLKRFFRDGLPAFAEILSIETEKVAFDCTLSRVSYQFEADGFLHRDTDQVLPVIAGRWRPGDTVQILYIADYNYDSVIISTI